MTSLTLGPTIKFKTLSPQKREDEYYSMKNRPKTGTGSDQKSGMKSKCRSDPDNVEGLARGSEHKLQKRQLASRPTLPLLATAQSHRSLLFSPCTLGRVEKMKNWNFQMG